MRGGNRNGEALFVWSLDLSIKCGVGDGGVEMKSISSLDLSIK